MAEPTKADLEAELEKANKRIEELEAELEEATAESEDEELDIDGSFDALYAAIERTKEPSVSTTLQLRGLATVKDAIKAIKDKPTDG
jgi:predicted nuclease with TOPRIM domain